MRCYFIIIPAYIVFTLLPRSAAARAPPCAFLPLTSLPFRASPINHQSRLSPHKVQAALAQPRGNPRGSAKV